MTTVDQPNLSFLRAITGFKSKSIMDKFGILLNEQ